MIKNQANEHLCARPVLESKVEYSDTTKTKVLIKTEDYTSLMAYTNCLEQK